MASISHDKKTGRRLIQLSPTEHPKRPKIRLGKVSKREAESARVHVESLIRAKVTGSPFPAATAAWLAGLPEALRRRLERTELVELQERTECLTLGEWLERYITSRRDVKESTRSLYEQTRGNLLEFFGRDKRLADFTAGDGEEFRLFLHGKGLAEGTIRRRCGRAKQFFAAAVARELCRRNPFEGVRCGVVANRERFHFVTDAEIEAVLDACSDVEWRAIFALARYGGLRVPSEVLLLCWGDINWEMQRFTVRSPKTAGQGKASRSVPLFPQLHRILLEAYEQAEPGEEFVISRYRCSRSNLRTQARRIIRAAGLEPWEKTFQNCRSTRETELVEEFPIQTVTAWLGNSIAVAQRHYLQVREEHYAKAVHDPVQSAAELSRTTPQDDQGQDEELATCGAMRKETAPCENTEPHHAPRVGLEPTT